ncbi:c-type cytochrome [Planctomicrobium sp. SH664]|uniref:c-type cytochrome n=1 Tax=Planctomicrobium sp. SH664 TaxID=3448125 RepID=UPI003F5BEB42
MKKVSTIGPLCTPAAARCVAGCGGQRLCAVLLVGMVLGSGCDFPGRPLPEDQGTAPAKVMDFETLYAQNCAGCHGADGEFGAAPPLQDRLFLALVTDAELEELIRCGRKGTLMPPFALSQGGRLSDEQIRSLLAGLRLAWGGHVPTANVPAYRGEPGDPVRGAAVYQQACANCHGENGEGDVPGGALRDVAFLSLISDQALRRIIITGRFDLEMPSYASVVGRDSNFQPLSSRDIDDVVALLAHWRTELSQPPLSGSSR